MKCLPLITFVIVAVLMHADVRGQESSPPPEMKALEKLVNVHVGERRLARTPLHSNQHAYQPGKSCETALHQLVGKVEKALHF